MQTVTKVAEWTIPLLPVLTVPLLIGTDECGKLLAISQLGTDEQDNIPAVGPFNLFCRSSCYINYEEEHHFLLWPWERMESVSDADASHETTSRHHYLMNGKGVTTWENSNKRSMYVTSATISAQLTGRPLESTSIRTRQSFYCSYCSSFKNARKAKVVAHGR